MGIGNLGPNSESQVQYRASQPQAEDHCGGVAPNEASKNEGCQASHYAFPRQKWPQFRRIWASSRPISHSWLHSWLHIISDDIRSL